MPKEHKVSAELAELLAAYGKPPAYPAYAGDSLEYARAVHTFERLSATPEAVARRAAMERYFTAAEGGKASTMRERTE